MKNSYKFWEITELTNGTWRLSYSNHKGNVVDVAEFVSEDAAKKYAENNYKATDISVSTVVDRQKIMKERQAALNW